MMDRRCSQEGTGLQATAPLSDWCSRNLTSPVAPRMLHGAVFVLCGVLAFLLRFDFGVPRDLVPHLIAGVGTWLAVKLALLHMVRMDRCWTRLVSTSDITRIVKFNIEASIFAAAIIVFLGPPGFPQSVYLIDFTLALFATIGVQLSLRRHLHR